MKLVSALFCLAAASSATAFVIPTPAASRGFSSLASTPFQGGNDPYYNSLSGTGSSSSSSNSNKPSISQPQPDGSAENVMRQATEVKVQGGSLKTWALKSAAIQRVQVVLKTDGRPMDADLDLWHGPNNTPYRLRVYIEDGSTRPFNAIIETPRGPNTVAIRNTGQIEFPLDAYVLPNPGDNAEDAFASASDAPKTIQGGALKTYPFESHVESVQLLLQTDGRPLNARLELLQGPNNIKQIIELYIEDGMTRPFFMIIDTPGSGNVVRVCNTASVEFPFSASVSPYAMGEAGDEFDIVVSGDQSSFGLNQDRRW